MGTTRRSFLQIGYPYFLPQDPLQRGRNRLPCKLLWTRSRSRSICCMKSPQGMAPDMVNDLVSDLKQVSDTLHAKLHGTSHTCQDEAQRNRFLLLQRWRWLQAEIIHLIDDGSGRNLFGDLGALWTWRKRSKQWYTSHTGTWCPVLPTNNTICHH